MAGPQLRQVAANVLTPIGWMQGIFSLPRLHSLLDHVEHAGPYLRLHEVRLPGRKDRIKTFVMQRNAVILIVPGEPERLEKEELQPGPRVAHHISCLLEHGVLHGTLQTVPNVAVGDFLLHHAGFVVLSDCVIHLREATKPASKVARVIVNGAHVIGASEEGAPATRGRATS